MRDKNEDSRTGEGKGRHLWPRFAQKIAEGYLSLQRARKAGEESHK